MTDIILPYPGPLAVGVFSLSLAVGEVVSK